MSYSVVWFKRDLRVEDHAALFHAARSGPVLCLYVIEPSLWAAPDASCQHYQFLIESLRDLYAQLRQKGGRLWVVTGDVDAVLERLHFLAPFAALYSHEETGNGLTYQRDLAVARLCRQHDIPWHEFAQFGVTRRLKSRNDWKGLWDAHVKSPQFDLSADQPLMWAALPWHELAIPTALELGLNQADVPLRQKGGRKAGLAVLNSFLTTRSGHYRGGISSPLSAPTACSRISPFLALGCLSLREVVQATRQQVVNLPDAASRHKQGLVAFISRLYWHCHFTQKLESEPALEYQNVHRGYDGLREGDWNPAHFDAVVAGRTGWPLVDACVAMLSETGWINFRMRAMLVSVAVYPLWLHWRPVGLWLAQQFFWTTSSAFTGARCKCSQAPRASTPRAFTTPSSRRWTMTRMVILCGTGCPPCAACRMPGCLSPGVCRLIYKRNMACAWASTFPCRWWICRPLRVRPSNACMHCGHSPLCRLAKRRLLNNSAQLS